MGRDCGPRKLPDEPALTARVVASPPSRRSLDLAREVRRRHRPVNAANGKTKSSDGDGHDSRDYVRSPLGSTGAPPAIGSSSTYRPWVGALWSTVM
ncbi:hypothetical protein GUJ93_ZPchr0012g20087 [Zizania palustris]|uniref:Uncharacterized protein n=1 Tax=Zizania palustris TaxID=103762 RepID=A0A8J6BPU1_ZIZPA|nr:hypothetical protein GUJ93_ZPchr0012g20087 [Zizania palustris]